MSHLKKDNLVSLVLLLERIKRRRPFCFHFIPRIWKKEALQQFKKGNKEGHDEESKRRGITMGTKFREKSSRKNKQLHAMVT